MKFFLRSFNEFNTPWPILFLQNFNQREACKDGLIPGREIAPNTGANATKFFPLATKSWKLVAKYAIRMFHHNLT